MLSIITDEEQRRWEGRRVEMKAKVARAMQKFKEKQTAAEELTKEEQQKLV